MYVSMYIGMYVYIIFYQNEPVRRFDGTFYLKHNKQNSIM